MDRDIQYINYKEKNLRKKDAETENMKENHMYKNNDGNNIEVNNKSNRYVNNESNIQINITIPVPILKANKELLRALREELYTDNYKDVITVDFSDVAQSCNVYSEYLQKASMTPELEHSYFGLAICGHKKKVNKLTGSMPLLR
ncbi:hypothetical protein CNEO3_80097 [Clostridium neonatale]|uniref:DUF2000 domain-containing protein n=1 Tax=Clostridium neonatale TaxID=137838 RepID=UPI00291BBC4E|nr:DUF2000 domain-containing protein [Clostridium neonatale]CAI3705727.1 hypothetical protein CNEO3_80097 [Clostridium neonatale]CAI3713665.1 hypothetical protein CNEO4_890003 [Clostridium neonatale]